MSLLPCDAGRVHDTHTGPRRANQERVSPRSAQDLDELEPVDRVGRVATDRDRTVALEEDRGRGRHGRRWVGQRGRDPVGELLAAHLAEGEERQRGRRKAVSGSAGVRDLARQGQGHRRRQWAWATAAISGRAAWTARWMARSEVGP